MDSDVTSVPIFKLGRCITLSQPLLFSDPGLLPVYNRGNDQREKIEGKCI